MQFCISFKVRKMAKIRNRYNQAPHPTQDTNGKVTTSQLDIKHNSLEVSPFPAGDHKALINKRARKHNKKQDRHNINDPQKKHHLRTVSKNILQEGFNRCHSAPNSQFVQLEIKISNCSIVYKISKKVLRSL